MTSLETTEAIEAIDDTLDDSNDKESVEEDDDLIVFPWYASN